MVKVWNESCRDGSDIVDVVEMGSSGPWHKPVIMAHVILGRRAMASGRMSYEEVAGQIAKLERSLGGKSPPSAQTAIIWGKKFPDYPEWAIRNELVFKNELLPWALEMLSVPGTKATMGQSLAISTSSEDRSLGKVLAEGAIFFGGLYVASGILKAIFGPGNDRSSAARVNESGVRPISRRMGRVRRKYHRPNEGGTVRTLGLPPGHY